VHCGTPGALVRRSGAKLAAGSKTGDSRRRPARLAANCSHTSTPSSTRLCCAAEAPGHTASRRPRVQMCTVAGRGSRGTEQHQSARRLACERSRAAQAQARVTPATWPPAPPQSSSLPWRRLAPGPPSSAATMRSCSLALTGRTVRARTSTRHRAAATLCIASPRSPSAGTCPGRCCRRDPRRRSRSRHLRACSRRICVAHACAPEHERPQVPGSMRPGCAEVTAQERWRWDAQRWSAPWRATAALQRCSTWTRVRL